MRLDLEVADRFPTLFEPIFVFVQLFLGTTV
jgi:hypothetical protein